MWYRSNPGAFFWDKFDVKLWGKAEAAIQDLADSPTAKVTVRAGHGTQKTFSASKAALWFSYCWRPSKVITTAPTGRQVEKLLWSEIRKSYAVAKRKEPSYPGRMLTTEMKMAADWFMFGFSSDEPTTAEGFHGENILIIIDEAKGVDDGIDEGLEGALGGLNARKLIISTPGNPEGFFYDSFSDPLYSSHVFSCDEMVSWYEDRDIPIPPGCVSRRWINERKQKWGEESMRFKMRVNAEFCESIPEAIIPLPWVEAAQKRKRYKDPQPRECRYNVNTGRTTIKPGTNIRYGLDIAEFGDDSTLHYIGDDYGPVEVLRTDKKELTETAGTATRFIKKYNMDPEDCKIDSTGLGSGVGSMLRQNGLPVTCIHFAQKSSDREEWHSIVTEMYWASRELLGSSPFYALHRGPEIRRDLTRRRYITNSDGAYQIEKKAFFKKREGVSPDYGDAFVLCNYDARGLRVTAGKRI